MILPTNSDLPHWYGQRMGFKPVFPTHTQPCLEKKMTIKH